MKKIPSLITAGAMAVAGLANLAPPANAATIGSGCTLTGFIPPAGSVHSYFSAPHITHNESYDLGPGVTYSNSKTVTSFRSISGNFEWQSGGQISSGGITKIIGGVKARFNVTIAAQAVTSRTTSVTQTVKVTNTSPTKIKVYVVFAGVTRYYGQYRQQYCKSVSGGNVGNVQWKYGDYSSWASPGQGFVLCGATGGTPLAKAAMAALCP